MCNGDCRWHQAKVEGTGPCARASAACTLEDGRLYIFGGSVKGARLNDLWSLDLSSFLWREIVTSGSAPPPRHLASLCSGGEAPFPRSLLPVHVATRCLVFNSAFRVGTVRNARLSFLFLLSFYFTLLIFFFSVISFFPAGGGPRCGWVWTFGGYRGGTEVKGKGEGESERRGGGRERALIRYFMQRGRVTGARRNYATHESFLWAMSPSSRLSQ